jgi:hypothetical protein
MISKIPDFNFLPGRCRQLKQKLLCVLSEVIRFYDMHTENRTLWVKSAEFFMTLTSFALLFFFFIKHSRGGILKSAKDYRISLNNVPP